MPVHLTDYLKALLVRVNDEPVVIGGVLLGIAQAVSESPSLKAAVPVVVALLVRQFTSRFYHRS